MRRARRARDACRVRAGRAGGRRAPRPRRRSRRSEPARVKRLREPVMHLARAFRAALRRRAVQLPDLGLAIAPVPLANYSVDLDIPSGLGASFGEDVDTRRPGPPRHAGLDGARVARARRPDRARVVLLARAPGARDLARAAGVLGGATRVFTDRGSGWSSRSPRPDSPGRGSCAATSWTRWAARRCSS